MGRRSSPPAKNSCPVRLFRASAALLCCPVAIVWNEGDPRLILNRNVHFPRERRVDVMPMSPVSGMRAIFGHSRAMRLCSSVACGSRRCSWFPPATAERVAAATRSSTQQPGAGRRCNAHAFLLATILRCAPVDRAGSILGEQHVRCSSCVQMSLRVMCKPRGKEIAEKPFRCSAPAP